jgi:hypothetical protein
MLELPFLDGAPTGVLAKATVDAWIFASGAIIVGLLSGVIGAALVRMIILKERDDRPEMVDAARAAAIFIFLFFAAIGVIVAVGVASRETLRPFPAKLLSYSPHVLAAGLIFILGRALGYALHAYTLQSLSRTSARLRSQLAEALRFVVTIVAAVLAIRQLGIDTGVLNILVAAVVFGMALAFALLVGLAGRDLGREIAYGRYLHRVLELGDQIEVGGHAGRIVALHPASIEIAATDGSLLHLTNSQVFNELPRVTARGPSASTSAED